MDFFNNYLNGVQSILSKESNYDRRALSEILLNENFQSDRFFTKGDFPDIISSGKTLQQQDQKQLEELFGPNKLSFDTTSIGPHPDFKSLGYNESLHHHCVSMFVDIKGSTRLALTHSLEEVRLIKDSLLTLCINVASFFGGHIHRLQGDAAFVQFVRRDHIPNDSVINALNAATVLCQFVSKDLAQLFENNQLKPIKIRIGIDYGSDEKVLWSHYGIPGCAELTTTSLHTDLAAKLQGKASENSIRIGKNVVTQLDLPEEFYEIPTKTSTSDELDRYIIQSSSLNYNQYVFKWGVFLNTYSFINRDGNNGYQIIQSNSFEIRCFVGSNESDKTQYFQNSYSIPKGFKIWFEIFCNGSLYHMKPNERINWAIINRGAEALKDKNPEIGKENQNRVKCCVDAQYLGHHYMKCTIERNHISNVVMKFPVFVQ